MLFLVKDYLQDSLYHILSTLGLNCAHQEGTRAEKGKQTRGEITFATVVGNLWQKIEGKRKEEEESGYY